MSYPNSFRNGAERMVNFQLFNRLRERKTLAPQLEFRYERHCWHTCKYYGGKSELIIPCHINLVMKYFVRGPKPSSTRTMRQTKHDRISDEFFIQFWNTGSYGLHLASEENYCSNVDSRTRFRASRTTRSEILSSTLNSLTSIPNTSRKIRWWATIAFSVASNCRSRS